MATNFKRRRTPDGSTRKAFYSVVGEKFDKWDVLLIVVIVSSLFYLVNINIIRGNALHDRPYLDSVFSFTDNRGGDDDVTSLIENAPPSKQREIGLINGIATVAEWIVGASIAAFGIKLFSKAGWFSKKSKNANKF